MLLLHCCYSRLTFTREMTISVKSGASKITHFPYDDKSHRNIAIVQNYNCDNSLPSGLLAEGSAERVAAPPADPCLPLHEAAAGPDEGGGGCDGAGTVAPARVADAVRGAEVAEEVSAGESGVPVVRMRGAGVEGVEGEGAGRRSACLQGVVLVVHVCLSIRQLCNLLSSISKSPVSKTANCMEAVLIQSIYQ